MCVCDSARQNTIVVVVGALMKEPYIYRDLFHDRYAIF